MCADIVLFPRSLATAVAFHEAARQEAAQENKTLKSFTQRELVKLAALMQRPLQIGLLSSCNHFQNEGGVMVHGYSKQNPGEVVFTLFKDMRAKEAIRYFGYVPLLNSKVVIDTPNSQVAFQMLQSGLQLACDEYEILHDIPLRKPSQPRSELT